MENSDKLDKYIQLLEANKNIILTGAPGQERLILQKLLQKEWELNTNLFNFIHHMIIRIS